MTGVIFDFNGTLFDDSDKQEEAWLAFAQAVFDKTITEEEFKTFFHGRNTDFSVQYLAGHAIDRAQLARYVEQRESIYRELCEADAVRTRLTGDVQRLLQELKDRGIPRAIATASPRSNVDWYRKTFHLDQWFDVDNIVYNDGTIKGKPDPEFYLRASGRIGIAPEHCIVFEDAVSGIESARRAGIGTIIARASAGQKEAVRKIPGVYDVIYHFDEFDRSLLQKT
ncbi:HAD family hydrolase [Butyricicoccus sp.]|uniref:HAD family hydrolase n=1 Tax=Butyricicoccus sp. TaxID=2049021 RepID=UPI003F16B0F1